MKKLFLALFASCSLFAAAALYEPIDGNRDRNVLLSLDVDESFLKDAEFQTMKSSFAFYKQETFLRILSDAYIYQPLIKQKIADAGLPPALAYMAMAESSFKPRAYSSAKAAGIWQFVAGTAKRYGLRVDEYVDERRDPIKSTDAAIRYLSDLHKEFGKWSLAIMAYNCGEGRVRSAIRKAGTNDLSVLMSVKKGVRDQLLPRETRGYLRKVLAMASLAESETVMVGAKNEHLLNRGSSYPMAVVEVAPGSTLQDIAKAANMSVANLKQMNPSLRYEFTPPYGKSHALYIPYDRLSSFKRNYVFAPSSAKFAAYVVQRGDNLGEIALRFGVSVNAIRDFNGIKRNVIRPGQKLVIPMLRDAPKKGGANEYVVKRGDSLDSIAKKFKLTIAEIKDANNLSRNTIYAGDRLIIRR